MTITKQDLIDAEQKIEGRINGIDIKFAGLTEALQNVVKEMGDLVAEIRVNNAHLKHVDDNMKRVERDLREQKDLNQRTAGNVITLSAEHASTKEKVKSLEDAKDSFTTTLLKYSAGAIMLTMTTAAALGVWLDKINAATP